MISRSSFLVSVEVGSLFNYSVLTMHAYIVVGRDAPSIEKELSKLAEKLGATNINVEVKKISEVRNLSVSLSTKKSERTLIVVKGLDSASTEASNSFLKLLEEGKTNVNFAVVVNSTHSLLPTIVSRCQIIRVKEKVKYSVSPDIKEYLDMDVGEKMNYVRNIKDRQSALAFIGEYLETHQVLLGDGEVKHDYWLKNVELAESVRRSLNANCNVKLCMTRLVVGSN